MNSKKEVQHVYLVGAKSLGAYGGYETFVYKLTEYHQNKENIKYHVACKANGDGCILNSSAYIGELVSGKTQTASYKGIGLHPVEKKEWHIVENAHEAIILKSDFEKVQARREQNKEKRERAMARSKATREKCYNHLSGMVYCGCCRRNMTFERRVHGTVKETHYGVFILEQILIVRLFRK